MDLIGLDAPGVSPEAYLIGMHEPVPVALDEHLPQPGISTALLCLRCRVSLFYQRIERPKYPRDFYWCRRCGRRYAAWEWGWVPGAAPSTDR
jgi:hypothetical protein